MTSLSMQGKPVLPMTIRKEPMMRGTTAVSKELNESGVSVKPTSLNNEAGVKIPLSLGQHKVISEAEVRLYHQVRD